MDDLRLAPRGLSFDRPQVMSGYELLGAVPEGFAALVILDPEYRSVLDKLQYGNEGARQKGRATQTVNSDFMIARFIREAERALRPSGHIALWIDKFTLGQGAHLKFIAAAPSLQIVELIVWNKLRIGMGRRARCQSEYLIIAQKPPIIAKGMWADRTLKDTWSELPQKWRHPHAKPIGLTTALIKAVTSPGDIVIDPCAGGYGVLKACRATGRTFLGCDLKAWDESR